MRYLHISLCLLMLLFIVVQYNDPDGLFWMVIYSVPAIWAAIAAFRPQLRLNPAARIILPVCILAAIGGMIYYWPKTEGWWRSEVWWEVETAREGMGMMIVAIVLLVVWSTARSDNTRET
ncbi:hypothetical protein AB833_27530 [Chromatiales bacterium (ex Bugula neritina AB1)]|nr:hypothetical protein AB833_27530 [Chromatiales bacterium (ex Bugula neritina AB1)]